MIKVRITKNIIRKGEVGFGLSLSQIIMGVCALAVGIGMFLLLRDSVSTNLLMTLIFVVMALFLGFGIVKINGMSLFKLLFSSLKGSDKRPYCIEGVYHNVQSDRRQKRK